MSIGAFVVKFELPNQQFLQTRKWAALRAHFLASILSRSANDLFYTESHNSLSACLELLVIRHIDFKEISRLSKCHHFKFHRPNIITSLFKIRKSILYSNLYPRYHINARIVVFRGEFKWCGFPESFDKLMLFHIETGQLLSDVGDFNGLMRGDRLLHQNWLFLHVVPLLREFLVCGGDKVQWNPWIYMFTWTPWNQDILDTTSFIPRVECSPSTYYQALATTNSHINADTFGK